MRKISTCLVFVLVALSFHIKFCFSHIINVTSLALHDCPSVSEVTQNDIGKISQNYP